jgi:hypothetical protein
MSNIRVWQVRVWQFAARSVLMAWIGWLGVLAAGCTSTGPATGGGAPLSPTPDLTATAAAAVLEQALTDTSATATAEAIAMMTATTADYALAPTAITAPTMTATPPPTATATPDTGATAAAKANSMATDIAATLTAQPSPTHTPTTTPTAIPTPNATATARALATTISIQVEATLAARATATSLPVPTATTPPTQPPPTQPPPTQPPPTQPPPPVVCTVAVAGELSGLWNQAELGCPVGNSAIVWSSWTPYERGMMMWRSDTNHVYGFFNSGWWQEVQDLWDGQSPPPSRGAPPPGLLEPIRGTGYIWGTNDTFFNELGWARAEQKGFCALVQSFERGFVLRSSTVATCKDNLFNHAQGGNFPLDTLVAVQSGGWQARVR